MPNYCNFDIKMKGQKQNLLKLAKWLNADYNYSGDKAECYLRDGDNKIPCEHHIGWRIFENNYNEDDLKDYADNEETILFCFGYCAWSVYSCMFEGEHTYISDNKKGNKDDKKDYSISLQNACKELGIELELFSSEPGMCFSEHYFINSKGELEINDCEEYIEIPVDHKQTYEEFVKDNQDTSVTKEEYDNCCEDYIIKCKFMDENGEFIWSHYND